MHLFYLRMLLFFIKDYCQGIYKEYIIPSKKSRVVNLKTGTRCAGKRPSAEEFFQSEQTLAPCQSGRCLGCGLFDKSSVDGIPSGTFRKLGFRQLG
ncbi:hypothetical protein AUK14_02480 [Candidatus Berkelbacteria bacterium CG2_30_39_44]|uniref:Uncharacterized protein n=2 Tax=Candidatus Berkelbacteria TaxID=1618330 RepID=A0A2M7CJB3_9BACT|nr:MAG: hypothetical protein AUK14_02480 [Candidatus Berkelbacteria bacterium CG2_30_39_44]PIV25726.1 MAG: hypothetical protein COS38_00110 [Candidatus Berkelbacteria bacterium CG03_land_8_20_14_0_80_40_36]